MPLISIDTESCVQDGLCQKVCPGNLIEFKKGEFPKPVSDIEKDCIRCGHCVVVCPTNSLLHNEIPQEECVEVKKSLEIGEEEAVQFLKSRRSIRNFKKKPVSRLDIEKVLKITRFAPTGHNEQDVKWSVYDSKKDLKAIADNNVDFFRHFLRTSPEVELPFDLQDLIDIYEKGQDIILRDAPVLIVAHCIKDRPMARISCYIALTTLELAAKGCGLGTCWAGHVMMAAFSEFKPLMEILKLPEDQQFCGALMLGYPKLIYKRIPVRNKPFVYWHD